jgi:cytidine deaminase
VKNIPTRALVAAARAVRRNAHAPYSQFRVGAAVADERGRIHVGCNLENASYGLTVCAERNAVAAAVAAGARRITMAAVVSGSQPPASPCGACRQVLAELADAAAPVVIAGPAGPAVTTTSVGALLPLTFTFAAPTSRRRR